MINLADRLDNKAEVLRKSFDNFDFDLRCAAPGVIQSFDAEKQTVTVKLAITERLVMDNPTFVMENNRSNMGTEEIPLLVDVPIVVPRAGGFCISLPIKAGDECLVIFADTCIDSWWANSCEDTSGNFVAQDQANLRRHDLSDGFAVLGTWSQPKKLENYSEDSLQIFSEDGTTLIDVSDDEVAVSCGAEGEETTITVKDGEVTIVADEVNLSAASGLRALIDERFKTLFDNHVHTDPVSGNTGVPTVPLDLDSCSTDKVKAL